MLKFKTQRTIVPCLWLGLSGQSVVKFFKKNKIKNLKFGMIKKKLFKNYRAKNLKKLKSS